MTVQELARYYVSLLIVQYQGKIKAEDTIELFTRVILAENLAFDIRDGFDIDTAIGVQLDLIDKYIGVGRGYNGIALSDDDFRFLMKLKTIQNCSDYASKSLDDSLFALFGASLYKVSDGNMNMTYYCLPAYTTLMQTAFDKNIIPIPMSVGMNLISAVNSFFGFTSDDGLNPASRGFSDYTNYNTIDGSFLRYSDIII